MELPGKYAGQMHDLILHLIANLLQSRRSLLFEHIALRHQLEILRRGRKRPARKKRDGIFWILLRRILPDWRRSLTLVQPEAVIRWHQNGVRAYWRRKGRTSLRGRPRPSLGERELIREMTHGNPCAYQKLRPRHVA